MTDITESPASISREERVERVAFAMARVIARRHGNNRAEDWLNDQRREEARAAIAALSVDERLIEALEDAIRTANELDTELILRDHLARELLAELKGQTND